MTRPRSGVVVDRGVPPPRDLWQASRNAGKGDPAGLPRHAGRARPRHHPARPARAPRRSHDAVHRQRDAAAAEVPARRGAPVGRPARRRPAVPARTGHERRGGQPAHHLLRDAGELEPRRLLEVGADPDAVAVPDRPGRPAPRADLRQRVHRRPRARHPARRGERRHLGRPVPRGRDQPRARGPRHRGARQRGRQPGCAHRLLRSQELVEPVRRPRRDAGRRPRRSGLRGVLPLPAGAARPPVRPVPAPELRRRPVPRDRQLGVHGVPQDRGRVRQAAPPQRRLRRRPRTHRGRLDRQPGRVPDRPAVADRAGAGVDVGQDLRRRDDRDAGRHRPHARSGAAGGRRRAARQQGPGVRDAPARPPGAALRARAGAHRWPRGEARPGRRGDLRGRLSRDRRPRRPHHRGAEQGGAHLRAHPAQGPRPDAPPRQGRHRPDRTGRLRAARPVRHARRAVRRGGRPDGAGTAARPGRPSTTT